MTTVFPGAIDSLPRPGAATNMDDPGFEGDTVIDNISDAIEAVEAVVGATATAGASLGYVRLHDGVNAGLFVPRATLEADQGLLLNGNMDHFQRCYTSTVTSTTTYNTITSFAADRWFVRPVGASVTQQLSVTVPDARSQFSLQVNGAASVTTVDIGQRIRWAIANTRAKQPLIFSCSLYNGTGGAFTPHLRIGTPTASDSFATVNNRLDTALQSCPDAAWTRVYATFDPTGYTDISMGMELVLQIPSGSMTAGKLVRVTQCDLRPGTQLLAYVPPRVDLQGSGLLEYYEKSVGVAQVPGAASTANGQLVLATSIANAGTRYLYVPFKARKRTSATVRTWDWSGNFSQASNSGGTTYGALTAVPILASEVDFMVRNDFSGAGAGNPMAITVNSVLMAWDAVAEL